MKQYLLVDLISDFNDLMSYENLKYMVIDKIIEDTLENIKDEGIVKCNVLKLEKLAQSKPTIRFIEEELESYSYKIIDLLDLQRDLEDFKQYWGNKGNYKGNFDMILKTINEEVKQ